MTVEDIIQGLELSDEQKATLSTNLAAYKAGLLQGLAADVAKAEAGSIMTRRGLDVLAKGIAGQQIKFTRVGLGDSMRGTELIEPTDEQVLEFDDLIHWREDIPMVDCRFAGNGTMIVQAMLQNVDFESGFWRREVGLFAQDPDTQEEVLYSYKNSGYLSSFTPSGKGAVLLNEVVNLVTVVDNATNIVATLDAGLLYVSQAQLIEHVNSTNPHPNIPQLKEPVVNAPGFWANDDDNHLHTITFEHLTEQIFSDEAAPIHQIKSRVSQTETNIANLFMQLNSLTETGLEANLLLSEDFISCEHVDRLKTKVLNTAGGPNDIYVESLDGILVGHYYTISDGMRNQFLRVSAAATNSGLNDVMFDSPVLYTYDLDKAYLYRTTAIVERGRAGGSSAIKESVFAPDDVWQGVSSTVTQTIALSTTQKNSANFELTGSGSFNSAGFFTLT